MRLSNDFLIMGSCLISPTRIDLLVVVLCYFCFEIDFCFCFDFSLFHSLSCFFVMIVIILLIFLFFFIVGPDTLRSAFEEGHGKVTEILSVQKKTKTSRTGPPLSPLPSSSCCSSVTLVVVVLLFVYALNCLFTTIS